jgi:hypothetical protein
MRVLRCYFELNENGVMLSMYPHVFHYNKHKLKVRELQNWAPLRRIDYTIMPVNAMVAAFLPRHV